MGLLRESGRATESLKWSGNALFRLCIKKGEGHDPPPESLRSRAMCGVSKGEGSEACKSGSEKCVEKP